jgi:hypothetical protein
MQLKEFVHLRKADLELCRTTESSLPESKAVLNVTTSKTNKTAEDEK